MVSRKMGEIECVKIWRENEELGGKRRRTVEEKEDGGREGGRWKRRRTVEVKVCDVVYGSECVESEGLTRMHRVDA